MKTFSANKRGAPVGKPAELGTHELPARVLVVDDEIIVRKLVTQMLKSGGYEVVGEADNGKTAVLQYKNLKPDLVILDVKMPIMDGLAALKEIRAADPGAQIVMLTSETDRNLVAAVVRYGARDYIVKPLERPIFLEKLRKVRGLPR